MTKNTQNKQSCLDFGQLFFSIIFATVFFAIFLINSPANSEEINNQNSCQKINGNYRLYGNSCLDHCLPQFNKYLPCVDEVKYGCDCGQGSCFYQGKCISKAEFEPIYQEIQEANQEVSNDRIEKMAKLMNDDPAYSQFIHDIFANYKDDTGNELKSQAQIMSEKFKQEAEQFVQNQQQQPSAPKPKPNVAVAIEAAQKPLPPPPIPNKIPQFFIDQQAKKDDGPKAAKLPSQEVDMIFPVIPLPNSASN